MQVISRSVYGLRLQGRQVSRSFLGGANLTDILKNPNTMAAARAIVSDPAAQEKLKDMLKDPTVKKQMEEMMKSTEFMEKVQQLRKDAGLPGADLPITPEMMEKARHHFGMQGEEAIDSSNVVEAEVIQSNVKEVEKVDDEMTAALRRTAAAKAAADALLNDDDNRVHDASDAGISIASATVEKTGKQQQPQPHAIVELREYTIHPSKMADYMQVTNEAGDLRRSLVPLRLFGVPDTGGTLSQPVHFYYYKGGLGERERVRNMMAGNVKWSEYLKSARPCMVQQQSCIFTEAPLPNTLMTGLAKMEGPKNGEDPVYEICRYKLKFGPDVVARFVQQYAQALPARLAGSDASSVLCTLLLSEVGSTNEVIELWRHGDGVEAMTRSGNGARAAPEWKMALNDMAGLTVSAESQIHRPAALSTWK